MDDMSYGIMEDKRTAMTTIGDVSCIRSPPYRRHQKPYAGRKNGLKNIDWEHGRTGTRADRQSRFLCKDERWWGAGTRMIICDA